MSNDLEVHDRAIVERLQAALPGLIAVYRFGSTAEGTVHSASDHDIAVLSSAPVAPDRRFDLQEQLAAAVGRDVDLLDLRAVSPVMAIQVIAKGRLLLDADSDRRGAFEDRIFGAYARLNEERRGILQRVAAEGTVYGR